MNNTNKKIAVVTLHAPNRNYGCALQAYALHKVLGDIGYSSEIINSDLNNKTELAEETSIVHRILRNSPFELCKKVIKRIVFVTYKVFTRLRQKRFEKSRFLRHSAFDAFEERYIPQGKIKYMYDNAEEIYTKYSFFVCGSDQVWNPKWYNEFFRMDFVPKTIPKFSYAASISADSLTEEQKEVFQKTLSSYIGVSVREKQAVLMLKDLSPVEPVHSLDPTLLLDRNDWDDIASERLVKEPYIFCYFLDRGENLRKLASEYGKKKKMQVVCIPYVLNSYHKFERKYNDKFIESASPADFISLIKYADVILTDSFHASVFSSIYEKEFFAFRRYGHLGMSSRIETLTQMFGTEERFCNTDEKESVSYMERCSPIDYSNKQEYIDMKEKSLAYLKDMLQKSEQMVNKE